MDAVCVNKVEGLLGVAGNLRWPPWPFKCVAIWLPLGIGTCPLGAAEVVVVALLPNRPNRLGWLKLLKYEGINPFMYLKKILEKTININNKNREMNDWKKNQKWYSDYFLSKLSYLALSWGGSMAPNWGFMWFGSVDGVLGVCGSFLAPLPLPWKLLEVCSLLTIWSLPYL